jgi:hypothetical protein
VEPEGLNIGAFNINPGGKNFPQDMKEGWFMREEVRVEQCMYQQLDGEFVLDDDGNKIPLGLKAILLERGLWDKVEASSELLAVHVGVRGDCRRAPLL